MALIDWAGRWCPVEGSQPCRVWIPTQPVPATPPARPLEPSGDVTVLVTPAEADELPRCLPRLVERARAHPGGRVTVDLGSAARVHLTGLHLLLTVLWRRVGPEGAVELVGGSQSLRARLRSLRVTGQDVRRDVFGSADRALPQRQEPAAVEAEVPQQRQGARPAARAVRRASATTCESGPRVGARSRRRPAEMRRRTAGSAS